MATPANAAYKRAQRRNERRFQNRGWVIWPSWQGTMRVRSGQRLTKAEKKALKKQRIAGRFLLDHEANKVAAQ